MPRHINRMPRHPDVLLAEVAVKQTRQQLQREGAIPAVAMPTALVANPEVLGLDGQPHEIHDFMLGVDTLGDVSARLKVNGKKFEFYRR